MFWHPNVIDVAWLINSLSGLTHFFFPTSQVKQSRAIEKNWKTSVLRWRQNEIFYSGMNVDLWLAKSNGLYLQKDQRESVEKTAEIYITRLGGVEHVSRFDISWTSANDRSACFLPRSARISDRKCSEMFISISARCNWNLTWKTNKTSRAILNKLISRQIGEERMLLQGTLAPISQLKRIWCLV